MFKIFLVCGVGDLSDKIIMTHNKGGMIKTMCVSIRNARTRLPGERTRVRRGGMRRRGRDATDRASVPRRATWRFPNRADAAKIGADVAKIGADTAQIGPTWSVSAGIGRNGRVRPKFKKKKKKKVQNAPFDLT